MMGSVGTDEGRDGGAAAKLPQLTFLGHSTVLIELGGVRVLTDPVLRTRVAHLNRVVAPVPRGSWDDTDVVLISHLHHDHCDLPTLRALGNDVRLVVPVGAGAFLRRQGFRDVTELPVGSSIVHDGVSITATPAVHDGRREPFGPRAEAIGFLVVHGEGRDEASVYFAGDTDIFDAMTDVHPDLDVALIPVWGWGPNLGPGHLTPREAARAAALLKPRYAVPVHWGTLFPFGLRTFMPGLLTHPPLAFAAAVRALRLDVEVLIAQPGSPVAFTP
jgi:L-ascorbate metabolism protein UlaG (beta-lactamase superfamily)